MNKSRWSTGKVGPASETTRMDIKNMAKYAMMTADAAARVPGHGHNLAGWIQEYVDANGKRLASEAVRASAATITRKVDGVVSMAYLAAVPFLGISTGVFGMLAGGFWAQAKTRDVVVSQATRALEAIPPGAAARLLFKIVVAATGAGGLASRFIPNVFKSVVDVMMRDAVYYYAGYKVDVFYVAKATLKHQGTIRALLAGERVNVDRLVALSDTIIDGLDTKGLAALRDQVHAKYQATVHGAHDPKNYKRPKYAMRSYALK